MRKLIVNWLAKKAYNYIGLFVDYSPTLSVTDRNELIDACDVLLKYIK